MALPRPTLKGQQEEIQRLRDELSHHCSLRQGEELRTKELKEKEAFNFALFHFSPVTTVVVDREGRVLKSNRAKLQSKDRLPDIGAVMYKDYAARHNIDMYRELMYCIENETIKTYSKMQYESKYLTITIAPFPGGAIITTEDITEQVLAEQDRLRLINQLQKALVEVETLRGLLPLCASCKKIRDDQGYWKTLEEYFHRRGGIDFSHTLCPDCVKHLYPELYTQATTVQSVNQQ
jgi:hypothetical protein